jgi:hypothetical protein
VKKVENKTAFSKETVECLNLIFWPGRQRRVHCHTAKLQLNLPGPLVISRMIVIMVLERIGKDMDGKHPAQEGFVPSVMDTSGSIWEIIYIYLITTI